MVGRIKLRSIHETNRKLQIIKNEKWHHNYQMSNCHVIDDLREEVLVACWGDK
jgi:hypothetical protein